MQDFGRLLQSNQFTDINFIVGETDTAVPAHIAMVAARFFLKLKYFMIIQIRNV